ncbi:MAG: hypothetical protein RIC87_07420, partial [Kiloniellales bacterium]
ALRVAAGAAIAASQWLDDAPGIAGATAPNTRGSGCDAGHKQFPDGLLSVIMENIRILLFDY